ncbi:unnamed protein product [Psylliodes chrysocephalus]|uniref:Uncharacterized protein n=1 Tax=Psylliodes chrysocephalus TaxID=3402493 RepID=A0A9P0GH76_9CUCU|nr:unnamed protein product [Psylliodes chrysocephala]
MLKTLVNIEEIVSSEENAQRFQKSLDYILENDFWFKDYVETYLKDHDYNTTKTSPVIVSYVSGYIARKATRFTKCETCIRQLKSIEPQSKDQLITLISKGFLIYPSHSLIYLISMLESTILEVLSRNPVHQQTLFVNLK